MKLDAILHVLVPKDDTFFVLFEKDSENLLLAARIFKELMAEQTSREERAQKIRRVEELEHRGDEITHQIYSALGTTFITPYDREDIHAFASTLDDILDYIKGASSRIVLYRVKKVTPEMERLAVMIYESVEQLNTAIGLLRNLKNAAAIKECLVRVHSIENEADDLFERAIASLFEDEDDPIQLIKNKELLVSLETATDQCEDVANVIETIIVKNT